MKRIRMRVVLLACWLAVFYGLEYLPEPVVIDRFAYIFVLGVTILALTMPRIVRIPVWLMLAVPVVAFLGLKGLIGSQPLSNTPVVTMIEAGAILMTTLLAFRVSTAIDEFENAIAHITIGQGEKQAKAFAEGASLLYRELRRARNHQRPLALLAVGVEQKSIKVALDKMVQEAQLSMMHQYALSGVSKTLCERLEDCAIVVQSDDHFLVLLPETTPDDLPRLVGRLRQEIADHLGVDVKIGTASFPEDGFTYEGLLQKATDEMCGDLGLQVLIELGQVMPKVTLPD